MLRQNQIGTKPMASISTSPTAKRFICGSAQRSNCPSATEYSIRNPSEAMAVSTTTSAQFRCSTLRNPVGTRLTEYSR